MVPMLLRSFSGAALLMLQLLDALAIFPQSRPTPRVLAQLLKPRCLDAPTRLQLHLRELRRGRGGLLARHLWTRRRAWLGRLVRHSWQ